MYVPKKDLKIHVISHSFNFSHFSNNEKILLTTMLTIKILFTINSLEKKKKLFIQNTHFSHFK